MHQQEYAGLVLWDKEPLIRLLAGKLTPVSLGICFFLCVSLPLLISAFLFERGFFINISWSISIVFLFPFLFGLSLKYYQEVSILFDHLFDDIVEEEPDDRKTDFYQWLDIRFNHYAWTILILIFSLSVEFLFFYQKQTHCIEG